METIVIMMIITLIYHAAEMLTLTFFVFMWKKGNFFIGKSFIFTQFKYHLKLQLSIVPLDVGYYGMSPSEATLACMSECTADIRVGLTFGLWT